MVSEASRDSAGAASQNGEPEGRFGVQQGGIQRPPVRVAGPCRVAVSACSAPDRQDAGLRWRCRCRVGATEPIQEPVSVRDRRQCAAWKLTHPGGAWSRRRAVVGDARRCSACGGREVVRRACAERVGGDSWEATVRWLRCGATACRLPDRGWNVSNDRRQGPAAACLSRARTLAAARRSPVRQDQARRSVPDSCPGTAGAHWTGRRSRTPRRSSGTGSEPV